jgi:hypothetical protein
MKLTLPRDQKVLKLLLVLKTTDSGISKNAVGIEFLSVIGLDTTDKGIVYYNHYNPAFLLAHLLTALHFNFMLLGITALQNLF